MTAQNPVGEKRKNELQEVITSFKYSISDRHSYDLDINDMKIALQALKTIKWVKEIRKQRKDSAILGLLDSIIDKFNFFRENL